MKKRPSARAIRSKKIVAEDKAAMREGSVKRATTALMTAVDEISAALNPHFEREDMRALILEQFSGFFAKTLDRKLKRIEKPILAGVYRSNLPIGSSLGLSESLP